MLFDDRLATVLRYGARSETAARTQYRQLLDLLGSMPPGTASVLIDVAYDRLAELGRELPSTVQSAILRAPGCGCAIRARGVAGRERSAGRRRGDGHRAARRERLALPDPALPMTARGFLRHRRDLPFSARQVLERLGVKDLVLPEPRTCRSRGPSRPQAPNARACAPRAEAGIGALVRRIEAFQRARPRRRHRAAAAARRHARARAAPRTRGSTSPATPGTRDLGRPGDGAAGRRPALGAPRPGACALLDDRSARRRPPRCRRAAARAPGGAPEIAGPGGSTRRRCSPTAASPVTRAACAARRRPRRPPRPPGERRPDAPAAARAAHAGRRDPGLRRADPAADVRPAPNEYRALAAAVAVDAARLLAASTRSTARQARDRRAGARRRPLRMGRGAGPDPAPHRGVLRPRSARIDARRARSDFTVGLAETDAQQLAWRVFATLAARSRRAR
jgi:hypothetical protein